MRIVRLFVVWGFFFSFNFKRKNVDKSFNFVYRRWLRNLSILFYGLFSLLLVVFLQIDLIVWFFCVKDKIKCCKENRDEIRYIFYFFSEGYIYYSESQNVIIYIVDVY